MRQIFLVLLTSLMMLTANTQSSFETGLIRFLDKLPKPGITLQQTMAAYESFEQMEKEVEHSDEEIRRNLEQIYAPLLELFKKRIRINTQVANVSKEEKILIETFREGRKGINGMNESISLLMIIMDNQRPLISSGKLSWVRLLPEASVPAKELYKQLIQAESLLNWENFNKQVITYYPKAGEIEDEEVKALQKAFDEAIKKLPKKKVIENGIPLDIEDPEKMILILERHKAEITRAFEKWYSKRYKWWIEYYEKLSTMSRRLDEISIKANHLILTDTDRSLLWAISDLQGRTCEALQKLNRVTKGFFTAAMIVASARVQVEESIQIYRSYKNEQQ